MDKNDLGALGLSVKALFKIIKRIFLFLVPTFFIFFILQIAIVAVILLNAKSSMHSTIRGDDLPPQLTAEIITSVIKVSKEYKVPASVTLAQIILESSGSYKNGMSELAYRYKNLFGVKALAGQRSAEFKTKEVNAGVEYEVTAKFRAYSSYYESILDHAKLLNTPRYMAHTKFAKTPQLYAHALSKAGYATAPNYAKSLIDIMDLYNLYQFDNPNALKKIAGDGKVTGKFGYPFINRGVVTSGFGRRAAPTAGASSMHLGVDIAMPKGTSILAVDGGVVIHSGWYGNGGVSVIIRHKDNTESHYYHMMHNSNLVSVGEKISKGQVIGRVGTTGASTGYHLHLGIKINGEFVDPLLYIKSR